MQTITLQDGFELQLDEDRLDNMELLDAMSDLTENDNPLAMSRVVTLLLGRPGRKQLYDHLRVDGRVPTGAVSEAVTWIFNSLGQTGKN